ncbi:decarboxylase [Nocardia jinanensis]|uniref:Diaminopimelate decarboxylase n=1 Tax=Nocardia jinanensis TaxID=382504 RepID=A0A917VLW0_9NOCA|nr:decarboxylase [Nocardia jinanensis]GGK98315.1 diaminopimelate decarboxylase [Nocardia jinanensis]
MTVRPPLPADRATPTRHIGPPALPAHWDRLVRAFLADRAVVDEVMHRFGTPVHLLFPQIFARNIDRLTAVLDDARTGYRICYAHKVNRSRALVRTAAVHGIGVDVASAGELDSAVAAGFAPGRIEVTGPKGAAFLRVLVGSGVTVNVDNEWELRTLADLADPTAPVPVLLRVSGFAGSQVSRFGIPVHQVDRALSILARHRDRLVFHGTAFHLDTGDTGERVRAADTCFALLEQAYAAGLAPSVLNVGGGLRQVFTADGDRFDDYVSRLRAALAGDGAAMSWGNNTFGYQVDGGAVRGSPVFHKYANTVPADEMLADFLGAPLERHGGRSIARVASDNLLDIWLEPGKALADHAGITVARVEFVKEASDGSVLVHVDISRDAVTPADQEVMADPLLLPGDRPAPTEKPVGVFLAGRLCLERDLITTHKVWLPWLPRPGDLLVFPNTAGYHMDLSAASAAMHPPPAKVAVVRRNGRFLATPDADYAPPSPTVDPATPEVS